MDEDASEAIDFEELRQAAAFVYVDSLDALELGDDELHHLASVLRLRAGERVIACDGSGAYVSCAFVGTGPSSRGRARALPATADVLVATGVVRRAHAVTTPRCVAFSMPKGERAEWTIQKLTEIGIDVIAPVMSARSVVRVDGEDADKRASRYLRIAREAGAQSRRLFLPEIRVPVTLEDFINGAPGTDTALAEPGGGAITAALSTVIVGPEGGFSKEELALVARHVDLGRTVLRAETAAIVAGTLLIASRDGLLA